MKKNPVKLFITSRIVLDAAYFRGAKLNYAKASINEQNPLSRLGKEHEDSSDIRRHFSKA